MHYNNVNIPYITKRVIRFEIYMQKNWTLTFKIALYNNFNLTK